MVKQNLVSVIVQTDIIWEKPEQNRANLEAKFGEINQAVDLIILPEMFTTGFTMQPEKCSEAEGEKSIAWMVEMAIKKDTALCGSLALREGKQFFNRFVFALPSGEYFTYDKRHLFSLSDEPKIYTAGVEKVIFSYKGWRICPQICYDLRFPLWAKNDTENLYDVLIYVANWPARRNFAWQQLLIARAIENQAYVIGCNRVGLDANGVAHLGHSVLIDPLGKGGETSEKEAFIFGELNKQEQTKIRFDFPFLKDGKADF